jgi:hypothetical protein
MSHIRSHESGYGYKPDEGLPIVLPKYGFSGELSNLVLDALIRFLGEKSRRAKSIADIRIPASIAEKVRDRIMSLFADNGFTVEIGGNKFEFVVKEEPKDAYEELGGGR